MSNEVNKEKNLIFSINNQSDQKDILNFGKALASDERIKILRALQEKPKYLIELSNELDIPISSVSRHMDVLAQARLVYISFEPGLKGHSKLCSKAVLNIEIKFEDLAVPLPSLVEFTAEMPIGLFSECNITAPCGILSSTAPIGKFDDPSVFFLAERANAGLLWFNTGFISYLFPKQKTNKTCYSEVSFSFEICSETIYHRNKWPSDITILINDCELTTFTSPGDFGGRRGLFTPEFWPIISTQFGLLMKFTVNDNGVFVNNVFKSDCVKISELSLDKNDFIKFGLKIKENAVHKGGLNLFGKNFGDYPQSIIMTLK